jgi:hypothetical protein
MTRARHLPEQRFAAKLLFQFRYEDDAPGGFRTAEERIVLLFGHGASAAYSAAQRKGRSANYSYLNDAGGRVYFEFVGITDLMNLGPETDDDEVWYDIRRMKDPMQRRGELIPDKQSLDAFKLERASRIR